jgi:aminoglycoside 3-N-acetyltransferase I
MDCFASLAMTDWTSYPAAMTSFQVQRIAPGEAALFAKLNTLFSNAFEDPETYASEPPNDAYLEGLLGKEHIIPLVAVADGEVVGGLVAYELDKFEKMRREIYIFDLAVAEAHRRSGIATALIERLREIAAERGAWVVYVQADYGDEPAIALYTKLGTREDVMHFDIAVPGGEAT